jgi:hypothetical protein
LQLVCLTPALSKGEGVKVLFFGKDLGKAVRYKLVFASPLPSPKERELKSSPLERI